MCSAVGEMDERITRQLERSKRQADPLKVLGELYCVCMLVHVRVKIAGLASFPHVIAKMAQSRAFPFEDLLGPQPQHFQDLMHSNGLESV